MSGRNRTGPPCIVDGRTAYDPVARGLISWYRPIPDQSLTADSSAYTPDHDQVIQRIPDVCVCVCFSNKRLLFSFKVCGLFLTTCTNISLSPVSLVNLCTISHISIPLDCISQNTRTESIGKRNVTVWRPSVCPSVRLVSEPNVHLANVTIKFHSRRGPCALQSLTKALCEFT